MNIPVVALHRPVGLQQFAAVLVRVPVALKHLRQAHKACNSLKIHKALVPVENANFLQFYNFTLIQVLQFTENKFIFITNTVWVYTDDLIFINLIKFRNFSLRLRYFIEDTGSI